MNNPKGASRTGRTMRDLELTSDWRSEGKEMNKREMELIKAFSQPLKYKLPEEEDIERMRKIEDIRKRLQKSMRPSPLAGFSSFCGYLVLWSAMGIAAYYFFFSR